MAVASAGNWPEALEASAWGTWSLIVVEPVLPDGDGIELLRRLRAMNPDTPVLALSAGCERDLGLAAIEAGATGFLMKSASCDEIVAALRQVAQGRRHVSATLEKHLCDSRSPFARREGYGALSNMERTVLRALAAGTPPKEIAARLGVTVSSVGTYRARILRKLGRRTTAELIRYVAEHRLGSATVMPWESVPAGRMEDAAVRRVG